MNYLLSGLQAVLMTYLLASNIGGCTINVPGYEQPTPAVKPAPTLPPITAPFVYDVPATQSDWTGYNETVINDRLVGATSVQESNSLQLEVRKNYGAAIQIYDKVTKQQLINFKDLGRESGMGTYGGPRSFADDSPNWKNIGYNPLQAGDDGGNAAPILFHGFINGWIYTKSQSLSWAHKDARKLPFYYEQWVRLDGNKVHVKVRLTHQRPDKTFYEPESQEWPFMMINGARKVHFYNGDKPFTYDATAITDGIESKGNVTAVTYRGPHFGVTEPWQAVEIGVNRFIGLYSPGYFLANYSVDNISANESWEGGNTNTYVAHVPMVHLDSDNVWYKEYTYIVGTEQEIRDYVYAQERFNQPDFIFNKFNGRNGWAIFDGGYDQKEPFKTDNWQATLTGKESLNNAYNAKLISPWGSWKATDFNEVYLRMAYSGSPGTGARAPLRLTWVTNGQAPDGIDPAFPNQNKVRFPNGIRNSPNQSIRFEAINDGKFHTYKFNFASQPNWKGIIQQFEIAHESTQTYVAPGEQFTLHYFGTRNPTE
ncbi:hypothetical protein M0L20_05550 [Spirosoma sp. RP8]|uniref:DUF2961 domain-containing protein n=1 Tax=Spirosoma liriopis TaxID=2937440 RepID=A0ABT0HGM6_9BACT|nr:hypothetical protein [Spirosoma liriopis]MCK8491307.1 hypothetical protein [Spirosoma liriopis]